MAKKVVIDAGHQGIGVFQIWRIAIKPSKYKRFKVLFDKSIFFDDIIIKVVVVLDNNEQEVKDFIKLKNTCSFKDKASLILGENVLKASIW